MNHINRILSKIYIPIFWTVLVQVLLTLPGSSLPHMGIFGIHNLDKLVHLVLFGCLTCFWCYYLYYRNIPANRLKWMFFIVFLIGSFDGILMEFIQRDYIPNRSFDEADIIFDLIGSSLAYGFCNIKLLKLGS